MFQRSKLGRVSGLISLSACSFAATVFALDQRDYERLRLSPSRFAPTRITDIKKVSPDASVFTLSPFRGGQQLQVDPDKLYYVSVKDSTLQTQRPYTPLSLHSDGVQLLVRRYRDGQVSRWLHAHRVGDQIEIRGPISHWAIDTSSRTQISYVFLVGGTGIAPVIQVARNYLGSPVNQSSVKFHIAYASRAQEQCLMKDELEHLMIQYPKQFHVDFFFDQEGSRTWWGAQTKSSVVEGHNVFHGKITNGYLRSTEKRLEKDGNNVKYVVCGPPGFVEYLAGPPGLVPGDQGQKGGILLDRHNVHKL